MKTITRFGIVLVLVCLLLQFNGFAEISSDVDEHGSVSDTVLASSSNGTQPVISFTPSSFSFSATQGGASPPAQILEVWNSGNGTLEWSASENATWLSLSPASGDSSGETDNVTLSVDISGLSANTYDGNITLASANASNSPQIVPVSLTISSPKAELPEPELPEPPLSQTSIKRPFWHEATGLPESLRTMKASAFGLSQAEAKKPERLAEEFLRSYETALGMKEGDQQWEIATTTADKLGISHVRLQQRYDGLPVFGADLVVHVTDGQVVAVNGVYPESIQISTEPELSAAEAYKIAVNKLELTEPVMEEKELVVYNTAILDPLADGENHLAYMLVIETKDPDDSLTVFVDAQNGKILHHYSNWPEARNRTIYYMGTLAYNESGPVVSSPSQDATNVYNFTGETYDYYFNTFGRDSFDNQGATMSAYTGLSMSNALWNGTSTSFGAGFATKDVVAHEWTHAVTQYTADLVYSYQSGALNEAMSDIFGCMVDRDDWAMGEDLPGGALRSLSDPAAFGFPGKVSEYVLTSGDCGGVHINCTIVSHAAYLMAEGGSYNGYFISGIGRESTEQIFYRALTTYLTSGSNFQAAYDAIRAAASDLYGSGSAIYNSVTQALQAVELHRAVWDFGAGPEVVLPDSFEDDDSVAQASTWEDEQYHNFHDAADYDWVKFSATTGNRYFIETYDLGGWCDTTIYLYDTNGTTFIAYDDDSGEGLGSRIIFTPTHDGDYYILIRQYVASRYGAGTEYTLGISSSARSSVDEYESDDLASQAKGIIVNGPSQSHNFHVADDRDWVRFSASAGDNYVIQTFNLSNRCDTFLYLYGTNGTTELARNDDGGGGNASRISWTAPADGIYYVVVRHFNPAIYGDGTEYELRVTSEGLMLDAYEPDDTSAQESTITVNGPYQNHNFHQEGDRDYISFTTSDSGIYIIETLNLGANCDTMMFLYDSNGTTIIDIDDDSGPGLASHIAFVGASDTTYFVCVYNKNTYVYGTGTQYDIRVVKPVATPGDAFEDDDTPAQANLILYRDPQLHSFHDAGDCDWIKFNATADTPYDIHTFDLASECDTYLSLFDTDGTTELTHDDDGGGGRASRIMWMAPADGIYYVRIRNYDTTVFGTNTDYKVMVWNGETGVDGWEPDDDRQNASTIEVDGRSQSHNFHDAGDWDFVRFTAAAGTTYTIETLNLGIRCDTVMVLFDTDGQTILADDNDSGEGLASRIIWTAPADGNYYIGLMQHHPNIFGGDTDYELRVISGESGADAYEPDDDGEHASVIVPDGASQSHNFHDYADRDWVSFSASANSSYAIETFNLGSRCDTYMYLYAADGATQLAYNDDYSGLASRIAWTATASGTYYIRIRNYWNNWYGADTEYDLRVTVTSTGGVDAFEDDDTFDRASTITVDGSRQHHNFHDINDHDWVKFSATANTTYAMETFNLGSRCNTVLYLFESDGSTLITHNHDGGYGLASRIVWTAPADGTYYIAVRHFLPGTYGVNTEYELGIVSGGGPDVYEPDDTFSEAIYMSPVPRGVGLVAPPHNFHTPGDNDWVSFEAYAGVPYVIETLELGSHCDTYMYLYDTNGTTEITRDDDGGEGLASRIEWTAPADGTYYVRTRHYSSSTYGPDTSYYIVIYFSGEVPEGPEFMPEPAATFKLSGESVHTGDILEMTILLNSSVSAVKIDSLTKPSDFSLIEVIPILPKAAAVSPEAKEDSLIMHPGGREGDLVSFWYSTKMAKASGDEFPALLLRWKVMAEPPAEKLYIKLDVTLQGRDGHVCDTVYVKYGMALLGKEPKIHDVQPQSFYNNTDKVLSITGSDFEDTPKIYLMGIQSTTPLTQVTFVNEGLVWGTVPQGTKAGTYKLKLDNTASSAEFDGITVLQNIPPTLSDGTVSPASGYTSATFVYCVNYTDANNHPPSSITVTIGGTSANMIARTGQDGDFTNGEIYEYSITGASIGIGTHTFQFAASDGMDNASGDTGSHSGPIISSPPTPAAAETGGGGGALPHGFTSLSEYITLSGKLVADINADSGDRKVRLFLAKGTVARKESGSPVTSIRIIEEEDQPALPLDYAVISLIYDIQPSGATFDPPATLIIKYDDSQIPQGVTEKSLIIATWNGEKWIYLESIVDPEANTISAKTSHLSIYTVMARTRPAAFAVAELSVTPTETNVGESVNVNALITNTGDLAGKYEVSLKVDGVVVQTREIALDGGDSQMFRFRLSADALGEHTVSIGGLIGTFKVKALDVPPAPAPAAALPTFIISDLSVRPTEVSPGEQVTVSTVVINTGGTEGSYDVELYVDRIRESVRRITLSAGASETVAFITAKDREGIHIVEIGGRVVQFTVAAPPQPVPIPKEAVPVQPTTNWWLIGGIVAGCIIVTAGTLLYLFMWRKRYAGRPSER
jgi:Zn-dependent metalloprotease